MYIKRFLMDEETAGEGSSGGSADFDLDGAVDEIATSLDLTVDETDGAVDEASSEGSEKAEEETDEEDSGEEETSDDEAEPKVEEDEGESPGDSKDAEDSKPPSTWTKEAAAEWAGLSPTIKAEVEKREAEIMKGIDTYKGDAQIGQNFKNIMDPHLEALQSINQSPFPYVADLVRADAMLRSGTDEQKLAAFKQIAADHGVKIEDDDLSFEDEAVKGLRSELNALKSQLNNQAESVQSQEREKINTQIAAFAADPKNEHFDVVANDIADLIKAGTSKTLEDAYAKAIWANPVTRDLELKKIEATKEKERKAASLERARKAKKLMQVNVKATGQPGRRTAPLSSIDDTLNKAFDEIENRRES